MQNILSRRYDDMALSLSYDVEKKKFSIVDANGVLLNKLNYDYNSILQLNIDKIFKDDSLNVLQEFIEEHEQIAINETLMDSFVSVLSKIREFKIMDFYGIEMRVIVKIFPCISNKMHTYNFLMRPMQVSHIFWEWVNFEGHLLNFNADFDILNVEDSMKFIVAVYAFSKIYNEINNVIALLKINIFPKDIDKTEFYNLFVTVIKKNIRENDVILSWSESEICFILFGCSQENSENVIVRVCNEINKDGNILKYFKNNEEDVFYASCINSTNLSDLEDLIFNEEDQFIND